MSAEPAWGAGAPELALRKRDARRSRAGARAKDERRAGLGRWAPELALRKRGARRSRAGARAKYC